MPLDNNTILEAIKQAKTKSGGKKFNQTIDMILDIQEVDMKAPEGKIQEVVELPKPTGKPNKVCIVASGEFAFKARNAQADFVLEKDALEALTGNKKELRKVATKYDIFVVEAPMMPSVGRILGPVLGPRGKMPIPVPPTADVNTILTKNRQTVVIRMRTQPVIQVPFGTEQMSDEDLVENAQAILRVLDLKLKRGLKNVKFMFIKTSMGEPVKIKP
ncbi:MAG: 50S ribosomal protein L1 [Nitrososphaerota archaeon]|jgi:large subunit ribosomal protein L1|nr:50S ribosomal protein L1 [Nitrososphaerota archaeon]